MIYVKELCFQVKEFYCSQFALQTHEFPFQLSPSLFVLNSELYSYQLHQNMCLFTGSIIGVVEIVEMH